MCEMQSNTDLAFLACSLVALKQKENRKRRWSKEWYKMRNRFTHDHLLNVLRDTEQEDYRNFIRMDQDSFDFLLKLVRHNIEKKDENRTPSLVRLHNSASKSVSLIIFSAKRF